MRKVECCGAGEARPATLTKLQQPDMKKSFLFNVLFLIFVNLLIKPFWVLGIDRTVQNKLGEQAYGMYFAIFNFTYLFQILLDFGLQNYNNREVATDTKKINELLPSLLLFKTILLIAYLILCIAFAYPLGYITYPYLFIILANQILLSFNIFLRTNISAHQQFIKDALLSVLDKLLMIIFCAILIWGNLPFFDLTITHFVLAQFFAYLITFLVCIIFSFQLADKLVFRISFSKFIQIAKMTLPYALIHFLMTTYFRIDGVMLEQLSPDSGAYESGIYAQSYRLIESLNNIGYLIAGILLPVFAYQISRHVSVKPMLKSGFNLMYCIAVSILIGLFSHKKEIIALMYPNTDSTYSAKVFGLLLFNFFPIALLYVIGTLLTANKNFKQMIIVLSVAVLINVGLNFILIVKSGAEGAAIATLITQVFMLIAYSVLIMRIFNISFNINYVLRLLSFSVLCLLLVLLTKQLQLQNSKLQLLFQLCGFFICIPILGWISGLLNKEMLHLTFSRMD